jgi:hypothetical protein
MELLLEPETVEDFNMSMMKPSSLTLGALCVAFVAMAFLTPTANAVESPYEIEPHSRELAPVLASEEPGAGANLVQAAQLNSARRQFGISCITGHGPCTLPTALEVGSACSCYILPSDQSQPPFKVQGLVSP